jgi:hypothetical protein
MTSRRETEGRMNWIVRGPHFSRSSAGRTAGFAGLPAPGCETQPFRMPSEPALQVRSRYIQPPLGAEIDATYATVGVHDSMQAASVTMTSFESDQKLPSLICATATIRCEVASRMRVPTAALP